jgi:hypothetical protein
MADIDTVLTYCGFDQPETRANIALDGFDSFDELMNLSEANIDELAKGFASRRVADGKISFGLKRILFLKASIHWTQDFRRVSRVATLAGIENQASFREVIYTANFRAGIRKARSEDSALSKVSEPGKLKNRDKWLAWSRSLTNYLSTILGHDGVPLHYVIRKEVAPNYDDENDPESSFDQLTVLCAPLDGPIFNADSCKVHQLIHGFVQGETAETWIKPKAKLKNGRIDFLELQAHYSSEGNKSLCIKEAEQLRMSLEYRNERAMSFEKFLTKMHHMFESYADYDEPIPEEAKIRLLFQKVKCSSLEIKKAALMVQHDMDFNNELTYGFFSNQLLKEVPRAVDQASNRKASGVAHTPPSDTAPTSGINDENGKIFTGYYKNFGKLSKEERQEIIAERKRTQSDKGNKGKHQGGARRRVASGASQKTISKLTREISSMKAEFKADRESRQPSRDNDDGEVQNNAGDQFGGRRSKQQKRDENNNN